MPTVGGAGGRRAEQEAAVAAGGETNSGFQQQWPIGEANASLIGEAVLERVWFGVANGSDGWGDGGGFVVSH